jgi:signal transduction histidine kinase
MKQRAAALHATLLIQSVHGSSIQLTAPLA